jgi:hypothetical protein
MNNNKQYMSDNFDMTNLGTALTILGWQIEFYKKSIFIHQIKYIEDLLDCFNIVDANETRMPIAR